MAAVTGGEKRDYFLFFCYDNVSCDFYDEYYYEHQHDSYSDDDDYYVHIIIVTL